MATRQERSLLCFGDSNTHGSVPMADLDDIRRFGSHERWTGVMASDLGPGWRVHEEGLPGRTTVHPDPIEGVHLSGLAALPVVVGTHTPLDAVVLMLGTNDLKARFCVGASDIAAGAEVLVRALWALTGGPGRPVPSILLIAPPPILETGCLKDMFAGGRPKSQALGSAYGSLARRLRISFLDAGEHIQSSAVDGIHLDADQHLILGGAIAGCLKEMVPG
jgi:lysophospholipase L1-like esterase